MERRDDFVKGRLEPIGKDFGYDLIGDVTEADRSKLIHRMGTFFV